MELDHRDPNCTGEWRPEQQDLRWRCTDCHKAYYTAPEVRDAARFENELGRMMKVLAVLGQQQLDADSSPDG